MPGGRLHARRCCPAGASSAGSPSPTSAPSSGLVDGPRAGHRLVRPPHARRWSWRSAATPASPAAWPPSLCRVPLRGARAERACRARPTARRRFAKACGRVVRGHRPAARGRHRQPGAPRDPRRRPRTATAAAAARRARTSRPTARWSRVFAGSLGARRINDAVLGVVRRGPTAPTWPSATWSAQRDSAPRTDAGAGRSRRRPALPAGRATRTTWTLLLAAADLAVSRAGRHASPSWPRSACRRPRAAARSPPRDHQTANAEALAAAGGAVLVPDGELDADRLVRELDRPARRPDRLAAMAQPPMPRRGAAVDAAEPVAAARRGGRPWLSVAALDLAAPRSHPRRRRRRRRHERDRHRPGRDGPPGHGQRRQRRPRSRPAACRSASSATWSATTPRHRRRHVSTLVASPPPSPPTTPRCVAAAATRACPCCAGPSILAADLRRRAARSPSPAPTARPRPSSMLATCCVEAGARPVVPHRRRRRSACGPAPAWGATASWFVVEADESDGTFLALGADVAVVTNVEPDHLEHWRRLRRARGRVRAGSSAERPGPGGLRRRPARPSWSPTPGAAPCGRRRRRDGGESPRPTCYVHDVEVERLHTRFGLEHDGEALGPVTVGPPGPPQRPQRRGRRRRWRSSSASRSTPAVAALAALRAASPAASSCGRGARRHLRRRLRPPPGRGRGALLAAAAGGGLAAGRRRLPAPPLQPHRGACGGLRRRLRRRRRARVTDIYAAGEAPRPASPASSSSTPCSTPTPGQSVAWVPTLERRRRTAPGPPSGPATCASPSAPATSRACGRRLVGAVRGAAVTDRAAALDRLAARARRRGPPRRARSGRSRPTGSAARPACCCRRPTTTPSPRWRRPSPRRRGRPGARRRARARTCSSPTRASPGWRVVLGRRFAEVDHRRHHRRAPGRRRQLPVVARRTAAAGPHRVRVGRRACPARSAARCG